MPIPSDVLKEVQGSHNGPCTTKDVEDMMNVERANMHDGSQHMGQPAIYHRAIHAKVLPEADKEQLVAGAEDMVTLKENRTVPVEVHWAQDSEYSLGTEHLSHSGSQRARTLLDPGGRRLHPYTVRGGSVDAAR